MRRSLLTLALLLLMVGCRDPSWQTKDVTGILPDLEFVLVDENGKNVTQADFGGQVVLLFFGFTYCPDVCPLTLTKMAAASRKLNEDAQEVQILFVSVDPGRDDRERLQVYTDAFGKNVLGLSGSREVLDAMTKRYRVTYGYGAPDAEGNYDVSHSSAVFVFDGQGRMRLLIRESDPLAGIEADLKRLLAEA